MVKMGFELEYFFYIKKLSGLISPFSAFAIAMIYTLLFSILSVSASPFESLLDELNQKKERCLGCK